MKQMQTLALLVLVVFLPVVALAQPPSTQQAVPQKTEVPAMQARVFQVSHVVPSRLVEALRPLASSGGDSRGVPMLVANDATMSISVRDFRDNLTAIESVIRLLDKPDVRPSAAAKVPVEIQISVIAASQDEGDKDTPIPPALASVVEQLRRTLTFKRYRFVTTLTQRAQAFGHSSGAGAMASPFATGTAQDRPGTYEYKVTNLNAIVPATGSASFTLSFDFALVVSRVANLPAVNAGSQTENLDSQRLSMATNLELREGEQAVVGSSSAGNGDKSIIVVLSIRRVGA